MSKTTQQDIAPKQLEFVKKILTVVSVVFCTAGAMLLAAHFLTEFVLLDEETDFTLGITLTFVGIADFIVATKILGAKKEKHDSFE